MQDTKSGFFSRFSLHQLERLPKKTICFLYSKFSGTLSLISSAISDFISSNCFVPSHSHSQTKRAKHLNIIKKSNYIYCRQFSIHSFQSWTSSLWVSRFPMILSIWKSNSLWSNKREKILWGSRYLCLATIAQNLCTYSALTLHFRR